MKRTRASARRIGRAASVSAETACRIHDPFRDSTFLTLLLALPSDALAMRPHPVQLPSASLTLLCGTSAAMPARRAHAPLFPGDAALFPGELGCIFSTGGPGKRTLRPLNMLLLVVLPLLLLLRDMPGVAMLISGSELLWLTVCGKECRSISERTPRACTTGASCAREACTGMATSSGALPLPPWLLLNPSPPCRLTRVAVSPLGAVPVSPGVLRLA